VEQWSNDVFTYAILQGLKSGAADANKHQVITVGELQAYVIEQVRKPTQGGQNPTARRVRVLRQLKWIFANGHKCMTHPAKTAAQCDGCARPGRHALTTELDSTAHSGAFNA
jgi:hypothetical protein